ncbi:MAG TPA: ParB/RepB/Spo0J family partition protein [Dehalococcoidia bacterium]|nr:ParB/RepB/Spo0J family partition protein [Dehalococcoidia bacterium]
MSEQERGGGPARPVVRGRGLGRGLGALIPRDPAAPAGTAEASPPAETADSAPRTGAVSVDIDLIAPNPRQPRGAIDPETVNELAESIRQHGVLQPLVVSRRARAGGAVSYQLIAGERRLHAARAAGLRRVPVVVREATPQEQIELALVENIQRADLNPLEEALAFQRLGTEFGLTQEALARRLGRSRTAVANTLRLLGLPEEIKTSLATGAISEGHARALLGLTDAAQRLQLWQQIVERGLSVRQTEELVRRLREQPAKAVPAARRAADPELAHWAERLQAALGTAVQIERGRRGGRVVIQFYSDEELTALLESLLHERGDEL